MPLAEIRTQIKTILEGVSGIGIVHEYERWAADWKGFLDLFKDANGWINGWSITRRAIPARGGIERRLYYENFYMDIQNVF